MTRVEFPQIIKERLDAQIHDYVTAHGKRPDALFLSQADLEYTIRMVTNGGLPPHHVLSYYGLHIFECGPMASVLDDGDMNL